MIEPANSIALITPVKDELENLGKYLASIESQSVPISCLVIVENDSTDGTSQYLEELKSLRNVAVLKVIHMSFEDKSYRVGKKYAAIINRGLEWLKGQEFYASLDYIGILDGDVFPEKEYYEKLTGFMNRNPEVGISSGQTFTPEGEMHIADSNFVRGHSRIWRKKCLDETGYPLVYTADTVSVALAHLKGWKTQTHKSARVVSREINVKLGSARSKGYHAYYRGHTLFYMVLKLLHFTLKGNPRMGFERLSGYIHGMARRKPRIENREVRKYFRNYLFNKLIHKYQ